MKLSTKVENFIDCFDGIYLCILDEQIIENQIKNLSEFEHLFQNLLKSYLISWIISKYLFETNSSHIKSIKDY